MPERIWQYKGPYERWVFGSKLGRPFSFPAIRNWTSNYFAALMDSTTALPDVSTVKFRPEAGEPIERVDVRYPPLWNNGEGLTVRPFCFYDPEPEEEPALGSLEEWIENLLALLDQLTEVVDASSGNKSRARYRVNFPINPLSWTQDYDVTRDVDGYVARPEVPKAIVAVIDDGIPFANRTYLDAAGKTRVSNCWLQSARSVGPSAVPFGRELSNGEIDALRTEHGLDEKAMYYAAGAIDAELPEIGNYLLRETTHGSHIMSMAAGKPLGMQEEASQDDIEIIAVQLPNTIAWDTSGFGKEMYMLSALHYVFDRAKRIALAHGVDEIPLVINFSYGWSGGRHDGQSEMDTAIEELLESRRELAPTYLVMPSGNTYKDKMHANFQESKFVDNEIKIGWQVQPDDRTSSYVEMWLPEGLDPKGYTFEVTPPRGITCDVTPSLALRGDPRFPRGDPRDFVNLRVGGVVVGQMSVDKNRGTRWRAMVALAPSMPVKMPDGEPERWAPSGQWTLKIKREASADRLPEGGYVNVWVQRDDDPSELRTGGRQGYLVDFDRIPAPKPPLGEYTQPLDLIRGFGSMNGVANAGLVTRVGGYVQNTDAPAPYSSAGGLLDTNDVVPITWGQQVEVCAVSDRSQVLPGTVAQGVYSGGRSILIGTSGAAPQVVRVMARALADGQDPMSGMTPQQYNYPNPIKNVHLKARLGDHKTPPLWAGG